MTMRALPRALLIESVAQAQALELLERAMELSPQDALPMALAAWCHVDRDTRHTRHFTLQPAVEKQAGRELALRAARLNVCDPAVEALLDAAYTLAARISRLVALMRLRWWTRVLAEHSAVWANRFRAPAFAVAGKKEEARRSFAEFALAYPELTIAAIRSALLSLSGPPALSGEHSR